MLGEGQPATAAGTQGTAPDLLKRRAPSLAVRLLGASEGLEDLERVSAAGDDCICGAEITRSHAEEGCAHLPAWRVSTAASSIQPTGNLVAVALEALLGSLNYRSARERQVFRGLLAAEGGELLVGCEPVSSGVRHFDEGAVRWGKIAGERGL